MDVKQKLACRSDDKLFKIDENSLKRAQIKKRRSGVLYMSKVPPFMPPRKVESLLSNYGKINRVYLVPEPPKKTKKRKRKSYIEGWIEFEDKHIAKQIVERLNGNPIGGKKGGFWSEDIWNLKYLVGFKWDDLVSQIAVERREREQKLRISIQQAIKENKHFVSQVEKNNKLVNIEKRLLEKFKSHASIDYHQLDPKSSQDLTTVGLKNILDRIF